MILTLKILSVLLIGTLIQTSAFASETSLNWDNTVRVSAVQGNLNYLICLTGNSLDVKNKSLNQTLFTVNTNENVKIIQSFGYEKQERTVGSHPMTFIKVQFPNRESNLNSGWVPEESVRLSSQCEDSNTITAQALAPLARAWTFPTTKRPSISYKTGMRRFGSDRDDGTRLHSAADLYRTTGEPAVAVTSGTVIRDRYYFYQGTYAIEVKHTGGRIVRYGEITGKAATGVKLGSTLITGQTLGYVGKVNSGCCTPMLHFEMYSGTATGALTQSGNKYSRRKDLMDPSADLAVWEKNKFGQSY